MLAPKITIFDNKKCRIENIGDDDFRQLRNLLSYRQQGYEYTQAYKNNGWNGLNYLINKKGEFSLGLLSRVQTFLQEHSFEATLEDLRVPIVAAPALSIASRLKKIKKLPRDYQIEIVETVLKHQRGIVRACTGSGKTLVIAMLTAQLNRPTNVYVISLDLLQQFHDLFSNIFKEPIGFVGNGRCDIHRINIVSVWTAGRALGNKEKIPEEENDFSEEDNVSNYVRIVKCLRDAKVHIFDECHTVTSETIKSIYATIDPERIYGLSGTPFRDDGADLLSNAILGEQIIDVPASRLIAEGWLAQPLIKFVRVPKDYAGTGTSNYQTVYKQYVVENEIRNRLILENTRELLTKGYQVLILFKQLIHGRILSDMFKAEGIVHEYLSGSYSLAQRVEVKEKLLKKEANLVLASTIFDVGVDISSLSALVLAGPSKSSIKILQRVGRCLRSFPGKKRVAVVDFYDDVKWLKKHSKIRHDIYQREQGFKLIVPAYLKDIL